MNTFITGGAGFIGSHIVDRLIKRGDSVTVYDNLSSGRKEFLAQHKKKHNFKFIKADLLDFNILSHAMQGQEIVFHMAANPDISRYENTRLDLEQGTLATHNVLEAMRVKGVKNIIFASSSVVYGEPEIIPTPEDYGPLVPISLYGASKLSSEGLICAYSHLFGIRAWIFRFANIIGSRMTHGLIVDLMDKLKSNPFKLEILGDGRQSKSYLLADECADAIIFAVRKSRRQINIFNLGSSDRIEVSRIARILIKQIGLKDVRFKFTGGKRGWIGDVALMLLSVEKINRLGWKAKYNSEEAVRIAIKQMLCRQ